MREVLVDIIGLTAFLLAAAFFSLVVPGLILNALQKRNMLTIARTFGYRGLLVTGIGTVCHETGHYLMCLLFGHKIVKAEFFRPREFMNDGVLGRVSHSYNKRNIWHCTGNFFIGAGPIIFGVLVIGALLWLLLPASAAAFARIIADSVESAGQGGGFLQIAGVFLHGFAGFFVGLFSFANLINPWFWLFMFLSASIAIHMSMSTSDLASSRQGIAYVVLIFAALAGLMRVLNFQIGMSAIIIYNIYVLAFMLFGILLSLIVYFFVTLCYKIKRRRRLSRR